jgi:sortase B
MDKRKIINIVLIILFITFVGLAVNEYFKYSRSGQIYEEAREAYNREKELFVEIDEGENTEENSDNTTDVSLDTTNVEKPEDGQDVVEEPVGENIPVSESVNDNVTVSESVNVTTPVSDTGTSAEVKQSIAEAGSVIGWVSIPGTGIDYPVTQTNDNEFYLTHNYLGNKDVKGAIYMDYRNDDIGEDRNYILYGHKMIDGSMFSDLVYYVQDGSYERYFNNYNIVKYDDYEEETEWKIFSAYVVDLNKEDYYLYTNYSEDEKYQEFINRAYRRSLIDSDIEVTLEDEIMTLVTCSFWYDNSRVIIHAVKQ